MEPETRTPPAGATGIGLVESDQGPYPQMPE